MWNSIYVKTPPAVEPLSVTEVKAHLQLDDALQEMAPMAPIATLYSPDTSGNVDNGIHRYRVTFVTANGETEGGDLSNSVTITDKTVSGRVALTGIPIGGSAVTTRKLYRTAANASNYLLLATIADNSTTTYTDNIADSSLGASCPSSNTTDDPLLIMFVVAARRMAEQRTGRYMITQTIEARYNEFPEYFELPPAQSITSIKYYDEDGILQTWGSTNYIIDNYGKQTEIHKAVDITYPSTQERRNAVIVEFVAGYGNNSNNVPAQLRQWILFMVNTMWTTRHQFDLSTGRAAMTEVSRTEYIDRALDAETIHYTMGGIVNAS